MVPSCGVGDVGGVGGGVAAEGDWAEDGAVARALFLVLFLFGILVAVVAEGWERGARRRLDGAGVVGSVCGVSAAAFAGYAPVSAGVCV